MKLRAAFFSVLVLGSGGAAAEPEGYALELEQWRAERLARLTAPDGWLSLVGLHFLKVGENRIGHADGNDVVLPASPMLLGTATLAANGSVTLEVTPGNDVSIDGSLLKRAELKIARGTAKPTVVAAGTLSFSLVDRQGRKALLVRDTASERRRTFAGLDYFPIDATWRLRARWEAFGTSRVMPVANILGQTSPTIIPGKATFDYAGETHELLAIDEGPGRPLLFVIGDTTNGKSSYAGGRFLYVERPTSDTVVLDFNRAENPPCAFTPLATCPLPPKQNRLPFALAVGEKNYRGAHE